MQIASIALQYLGGRSLSNAGRRGQEPDAMARLLDQTVNTFALGGFNLLSLLLNIGYWITISFLTSSRLLTSQSVQKTNGLAKNSINLKLLLPLSLAGLVNLLFISLNILNLLIFKSRRILYLSRVIGMLSLKIDAAIFFLVLFPIFRSHIHYHHRDIEEQFAESPETETNFEKSNSVWDRLKLNLGIREEEPPTMKISGPMPIFHAPGISPTNKTNQNMQTQTLESSTFGKQFADDELLSRSNRLSTATIERTLQSNFLDFEYWTIQRDTAYSKK
ncbi:hypothetical protein BKA69DRAFT_1056308 [Paraphysoderma sedebokerense]|nr:hypothetical protein BKA69DRAFT_1056308 [Paraphysoderma sedebokerense]